MRRFLAYFFATLTVLVLAFFALSFFLEYKPQTEMQVGMYFGKNVSAPEAGKGAAHTAVLPQTVKIMSWNIGYAGLGDNMDFFMDGGTMVRDSKSRTLANLGNIVAEMKNQDADIYILQEVDKSAHRTYGINEIDAIAANFPDHLCYYVPNFKVWFVPVPVKEPIGRVNGGLLLLTRIRPLAVRRVQYPSIPPFPESMFNLKRCMLEADFKTSGGSILHLCNTHCTAFDKRGMNVRENEFLKERLSNYAENGENFIVGGDWNQYPPQYTPSKEELENAYFAPNPFDTTGTSAYAKVVCDMTHPTMRYDDYPYSENSTKSLIDFFFCSKTGLKVLDMHTIDLNFQASDHNPVVIQLSTR